MRSLLTIRGFVSWCFAVRFFAYAREDWHAPFDVLADYLVIDGVLGAIIAAGLFRESEAGRKRHLANLALVLAVDAIGRVMFGIGFTVWPGISRFPVTAVTSIALMALFTAGVGLAESVLIGEEEIARFGPRHAREEFSVRPVLAWAIASMAFGATALLYAGDMPVLRLILSGYAIAAGGVMFAMAWARRNAMRVTPRMTAH